MFSTPLLHYMIEGGVLVSQYHTLSYLSDNARTNLWMSQMAINSHLVDIVLMRRARSWDQGRRDWFSAWEVSGTSVSSFPPCQAACSYLFFSTWGSKTNSSQITHYHLSIQFPLPASFIFISQIRAIISFRTSSWVFDAADSIWATADDIGECGNARSVDYGEANLTLNQDSSENLALIRIISNERRPHFSRF